MSGPKSIKSQHRRGSSGGRDGEVRLYGTISNDLHAIEKLLTRLVKRTEKIRP